MARHDPAQSGHRQATLPAERDLVADRFDHRVDQHGQILLGIAGQIGQPLAADAEDDDAPRHVHLRRGNSGAAGILHRFDHVLDEAAHPGGGRVLDRLGRSAQHRMPHAGDFQQSHVPNM